MNSLARNALRLSLAGAGIAVLGAGVAGQASAAELPDLPEAPDAGTVTDTLPTPDTDVAQDAEGEATFGPLQAPEMASDGLPELPAADSLPALPGLPQEAPAASHQADEISDEEAAGDEAPAADEAASDDDAAAEEPASPLGALPTDALPLDALPLDALPTDALPTDALTEAVPAPDAEALPTLDIPGVMHIEAPNVTL